jgi:hypothetical protein
VSTILIFEISDACGFDRSGVTHERGQDVVRTSDGINSVEQIWARYQSISWRFGRAYTELFRVMAFAQLTWRESLRYDGPNRDYVGAYHEVEVMDTPMKNVRSLCRRRPEGRRLPYLRV